MPDRREFLIGGLAVGSLGVAEYLRPRETVRLFADVKLEDALPTSFGKWQEHPGGNVVAPTTPGSLADRLYSATVTRVYYPTDQSGPPVMFLAAYGGVQSDMLQLHRPEACYPAVGLPILAREAGQVPLPGGGAVPSVYLSAGNQDRFEDIVYWTRLGEALPRTAGEQRDDRLKAAMMGTIGDGMLVRASTTRVGTEPMWPYVSAFLSDIMAAVAPQARKGFVGTKLARSMPGGATA